mgnify:CR=1 FL=1
MKSINSKHWDGTFKSMENAAINDYKNMGITKIVIEEPLLNSNNIWTVGTLLRYNSMISRSIYKTLGIIPKSLAISILVTTMSSTW